MRTTIVFLIAFVLVCVLNVSLKSHFQETTFIEELIDPMGIIIRLVIAFVITGPILKIIDKKKLSLRFKIFNIRRI